MLLNLKHISIMLSRELVQKAMSWEEFYSLNERLAKEKKTSGPNQDESLIKYTELNWARMHRLEKTIEIDSEIQSKIKSLQKSYIVFIINEVWCGDGAQSLPAIAKMCALTENLEIKIILRDEFPEIMDLFLTNGARAIPKIILLDSDTLEVKGLWGPKPKTALEMLADWKANANTSKSEFNKELHSWYTKNKTIEVQNEFLSLLLNAEVGSS